MPTPLDDKPVVLFPSSDSTDSTPVLRLSPCLFCHRQHTMAVLALEYAIIEDGVTYIFQATCPITKHHYILRMDADGSRIILKPNPERKHE